MTNRTRCRGTDQNDEKKQFTFTADGIEITSQMPGGQILAEGTWVYKDVREIRLRKADATGPAFSSHRNNDHESTRVPEVSPKSPQDLILYLAPHDVKGAVTEKRFIIRRPDLRATLETLQSIYDPSIDDEWFRKTLLDIFDRYSDYHDFDYKPARAAETL